ncbi:alpha/beta hydrolase [Oceanobacillus neutriphilus]|nr:alpha/beta hydrolase [Oceanobacillus neutriphilus]
MDAQMKTILKNIEASGSPPLGSLPPKQEREAFIATNKTPGKKLEPVNKIVNRNIQGPGGNIPIRIYNYSRDTERQPVMVFFHGGGFVTGNLETHDYICRAITNRAECVVVSVDYRLAPEHQFPAAVEDCYAATQWISQHATELNIDPSRIAVGGDSSGGNLATVVSYQAKQKGSPKLICQMLLYPLTQFSFDTVSRRENGKGYVLTKKALKYYRKHYLKTLEEAKNPFASPLLIDDVSNLPPAIIVTAEYDPLRDEGEAYGKRLKEAGVPVTLTRYNGVIHGFVAMAAFLKQGKNALEETTVLLRSAFGEGRSE